MLASPPFFIKWCFLSSEGRSFFGGGRLLLIAGQMVCQKKAGFTNNLILKENID
jgi:hypothetical protein